MCHQTIEKTVKAIFVNLKTATPPYKHNLSHLAKEAGLYENLPKIWKDLFDELDFLNIEARYPARKGQLYRGLSEEKCTKLLNRTTELYQWLKQQL
jgi:HEPN domain-containing protein